MSLISVTDSKSNLSTPAHSLAHSNPQAGGNTAASFKIQLLIKASDIGFEALYQELAAAGCTSHRTRHLKRVLHQIVSGQHAPDVLDTNASPSTFNSRMPSFKVEFRLSERDVGLEKLFLEICRIEGASQRSHYVKRRLFNAYCLSAQPRSTALPVPVPVQPIPDAIPLTHSNPAKPDAGVLITTWSNASPTEAQEPDAGIEKSVRKQKKRLGITGLLEPKKP